MIDTETTEIVRWIRLGEKVAGVKPLVGRCERCGEVGRVAEAKGKQLCLPCYLAVAR